MTELSNPTTLTKQINTHTHTHTYIYIYLESKHKKKSSFTWGISAVLETTGGIVASIAGAYRLGGKTVARAREWAKETTGFAGCVLVCEYLLCKTWLRAWKTLKDILECSTQHSNPSTHFSLHFLSLDEPRFDVFGFRSELLTCFCIFVCVWFSL